MHDVSTTDLHRWIMRSTTDGLWIFDGAGNTVFANDRLADILGRTSQEMQRLQVADALDPAGREQFLRHLEELALSDTGADNLECSLLRKDGSRIWALISHSPLLDDEGRSRGWLHRVTELTDRKLLLDQVTSSEQKLAEAQSIARVGSWEWDVRNDVVSWSDELYRMYELQPQEFEATYEGFLAHVHPEDRPLVEAAVGEAFSETDTFEFEARILKQSGLEGWIRGRGRVTRDEAGAPVRMGGTSQEITESVRVARELAAARDEAMQASRMKSEFLATMSHEIRTPLNGVIGLTELLRKTDLAPAQERLASGIAQAGRTLLELVNDILDLSKIEAGRLELEVVDFDVREVIDRVAGLMLEPARLKSLDLVVACHADVPRTVRGDPVRFGQVVTNLVSNAVKFTSAGEVSLRVDTVCSPVGRSTLRLEVTDTGVGIPLEVQPRLFQSFTQADASTTREYGGTGLGLAISQRLVEALGGEIGFVSEPGAGTTFWFTAAFEEAGAGPLPVPEPAREPRPREELVPGTRGLVLVAEDNAVNQLVARGMLEGLGFGVAFAQDGEEAVAAVAQAPQGFVAVLMDCQMPRLDGYAATRAIRAQEPAGTRLPIIAMTASVVLGEEQRCLDAGMDDFLVKPVDFEKLDRTLIRWIEGTDSLEGPADRAVDAGGPLDLDRIAMLTALGAGDRSLFVQFVDSFADRVTQDVAAIRSAVACADHPRLVASAHLLKGSAQNLGAAEVGRTCQLLEDAGQSEELTEAAALADQLPEQVESTVAALRDLVGGTC